MNNKKIIILCFFLSIFNNAQAEWRFYGSLGAAFHQRTDDFKSNFSRLAISVDAKKKLSNTGFMSEYALGVKKKIDSFALNTEIFFNYNNSQRSNDFDNVRLEYFIPIIQTPTLQTSQRKSFGLRLLGQMPVYENVSILAGVDLLLTQFEINLQTKSAAVADHTAYSGKKTVYKFGFAPTIGAEAKLNETFSLRGTYAYQIHRDATFNNLVQVSNDLVTTTTYQAKLKPRAHVLKVNLIIHF